LSDDGIADVLLSLVVAEQVPDDRRTTNVTRDDILLRPGQALTAGGIPVPIGGHWPPSTMLEPGPSKDQHQPVINWVPPRVALLHMIHIKG
jgi:hypothetical protein